MQIVCWIVYIVLLFLLGCLGEHNHQQSAPATSVWDLGSAPQCTNHVDFVFSRVQGIRPMTSRPTVNLEQLIFVLFINLKQLFCRALYVFILSGDLPNRREIIIPLFTSNAVWIPISVYEILKIISHQNISSNHFQMLVDRWRCILALTMNAWKSMAIWVTKFTSLINQFWL